MKDDQLKEELQDSEASVTGREENEKLTQDLREPF